MIFIMFNGIERPHLCNKYNGHLKSKRVWT